MIHQIFALLTRPAAMIAAFAGIIALTAIMAAYRGKRRLARKRKDAEREARKLVRLMRHCPRFRKDTDRRLAVVLSMQIKEAASSLGLALHELGTSQDEIDKILLLVREDTVADPRSRWPNALHRVMNPKEPGTPDIPINSEIVPDGTEKLLFAVTFSAHEFAARADAKIATEQPGQETVEIIVDATEWPEQPHSSDPLVALRSMDLDAIDDYIDTRFLAIQVNDKD